MQPIPVSFDVEGDLIRPALLAPPLVCLSSATSEGAKLFHADPESRVCITDKGEVLPAPPLREHFGWILQQDPIYNANIAFDLCSCLAEWPEYFPEVFKAYDEDRIIDIILSQRLADNARGLIESFERREEYGYSQAGLTSRHLNKDRSAEKDDPNSWRLRFGELRKIPLEKWPSAPVKYSLEDSVDALAIANSQWDKYESYLANSPAQARAAFALQLMMCWGVKTDPVAIERLRSVAQEIHTKLTAELEVTGLVRGETCFDHKKQLTKKTPTKQIGTCDTKLVQRRMFDVCKEAGMPIKLTKTGYQLYREKIGKRRDIQPEQVFTEDELLKYTSTDADACKESGDEILVKYGRRKQVHSIVNTHVPDLLKGVITPIQPRYTTMVDSGRTSCSKGAKKGSKKKPPLNGFQFQNPKKELDYFPKGVGVRECFVAREDRYFADNDFSGLELHTGAQVCLTTVGYSRLADALNAQRDPHLQFAAQMLGISYEEAYERRHEKVIKHTRSLAKIANFGYPGGLGAEGLIAFARGYGVKITLEDAKKLRNDWFEAYPEWVDYFKWIRRHIDRFENVGDIEQLYVKRIRGAVRYTEACNTLFQGLGADGAKEALYEVTRRCYVKTEGSCLYGARPVGFIHDEILAEVFVELAHEQAIEMAEVMVNACNKFLPDVPVRCEPALSKHWTKDAVAVYDRDLRLQPFDLARIGRWDVYYKDGKAVDWDA